MHEGQHVCPDRPEAYVTFLEIQMETTSVIKSLAVMAMLATAAAVSAEVGVKDGTDQFSGFTSSRTRAEVQDEIGNARTQGDTESNRMNGGKEEIGAYGASGSRFSSRPERVEVDASRRPLNSTNIYFGD
jgi:hypothetical protein